MIYMELIIGLIGMTLILAGFILNEVSRKLSSDTKTYNLINFIGAGFLAYYAYLLNSIPFLILNIVWSITAIWKLETLFFKTK